MVFCAYAADKGFKCYCGACHNEYCFGEAAGIKAKGAGGWIKGFAQPMAFMTPLNVLEIVIKPLSLCMRLFGNVLGSFVIMELIKMVVPVFVPLAFSFYFDIFDGLLQAYVFVFLTSLYIQEVTETE
ncbi:MAG: F0F1 ATP synthase subunit A [Monoglobus pectinilyticus]